MAVERRVTIENAVTNPGNVSMALTWGDAVTLASTNTYGGATADLAADQAYDYTADIDLETAGWNGIFVTLERDSAGTTDNIIFSIFGSLDGTTFDDDEIYSVTVTATTGADRQISFMIPDMPPHSRIGVKTSGATDTFDYRISYRPFR